MESSWACSQNGSEDFASALGRQKLTGDTYEMKIREYRTTFKQKRLCGSWFPSEPSSRTLAHFLVFMRCWPDPEGETLPH